MRVTFSDHHIPGLKLGLHTGTVKDDGLLSDVTYAGYLDAAQGFPQLPRESIRTVCIASATVSSSSGDSVLRMGMFSRKDRYISRCQGAIKHGRGTGARDVDARNHERDV